MTKYNDRRLDDLPENDKQEIQSELDDLYNNIIDDIARHSANPNIQSLRKELETNIKLVYGEYIHDQLEKSLKGMLEEKSRIYKTNQTQTNKEWYTCFAWLPCKVGPYTVFLNFFEEAKIGSGIEYHQYERRLPGADKTYSLTRDPELGNGLGFVILITMFLIFSGLGIAYTF